MALIGFHKMEKKRENVLLKNGDEGVTCPGRFISYPDASHSLLSLMKPQKQSHGTIQVQMVTAIKL